MSYAEIEAELDNLAPDELRRLALKSWSAFVEKEDRPDAANWCDEEDAPLMAALDDAVARADATPGQGRSADQLRARIGEWTSK